MKAKILVYALPALILATIHLAEAQQPKKVPRIGFSSRLPPPVPPLGPHRGLPARVCASLVTWRART